MNAAFNFFSFTFPLHPFIIYAFLRSSSCFFLFFFTLRFHFVRFSSLSSCSINHQLPFASLHSFSPDSFIFLISFLLRFSCPFHLFLPSFAKFHLLLFLFYFISPVSRFQFLPHVSTSVYHPFFFHSLSFSSFFFLSPFHLQSSHSFPPFPFRYHFPSLFALLTVLNLPSSLPSSSLHSSLQHPCTPLSAPFIFLLPFTLHLFLPTSLLFPFFSLFLSFPHELSFVYYSHSLHSIFFLPLSSLLSGFFPFPSLAFLSFLASLHNFSSTLFPLVSYPLSTHLSIIFPFL